MDRINDPYAYFISARDDRQLSREQDLYRPEDGRLQSADSEEVLRHEARSVPRGPYGFRDMKGA